VAVSFRYDPLGRRISKTCRRTLAGQPHGREVTTRFVWEGARLLQEIRDAVPLTYVYSDQHSHEPLARIDGVNTPDIYWFHNQPNGTPERLTDAEGKVCWKGQNSAWGKLLHERDVQLPYAQNLRMQGQYLDRETGLHYNLFRYYDPDCGRFTQQDPIGLAGGLNLYQYAPNPLSWIDPLGLLKCGLTDNEVGDASNLPVTKPGSKEWKQAVDMIRNNGSSKPNFRVADKSTAENLLKDSKPKIPEYPEYFGSKNYPDKTGFEHHPSEAHTMNAPENNLPHIKWSDYGSGKKAPGSGKGHIFYD
jgi:RHS repeat-associated protein